MLFTKAIIIGVRVQASAHTSPALSRPIPVALHSSDAGRIVYLFSKDVMRDGFDCARGKEHAPT